MDVRKVLLLLLLLLILLLVGCTKYNYHNKLTVEYPCKTVEEICTSTMSCDLKIITWSNLKGGEVNLIGCDVVGSITDRDNEAAREALKTIEAVAKELK